MLELSKNVLPYDKTWSSLKRKKKTKGKIFFPTNTIL